MRVLIVDDEIMIRDLLMGAMNDAGFQCKAVEFANEALVELRIGNYDVLISDINLVGMSGIELAERLLRDPGMDPAIILMTGNLAITPEFLSDKGVQTLIRKPFELEQVVAAVHSAHQMKVAATKRRFRRVSSNVQTKLKRESDSIPIQARSENIGLGGMQICITNPEVLIEPDELVDFSFAMTPGAEEMRGRATVRWIKKEHKSGTVIQKVGLEFSSLSVPERSRLLDFLSKFKTV